MSDTKVFTAMLGSSVWVQSPPATKVVWVTLIGLSDRHGIVHATDVQLADRARVPLEATRAALERLLTPDPFGHPAYDGRHVEVVDGGWCILNEADR